jgi:hypothetical protein
MQRITCDIVGFAVVTCVHVQLHVLDSLDLALRPLVGARLSVSPFVKVEFSTFACPPCWKHETWPEEHRVEMEHRRRGGAIIVILNSPTVAFKNAD